MKAAAICLGMATMLSQTIAQSEPGEPILPPSIQHKAFKPGEKLTFEVSYGWIDAGEVTIEIKKDRKKIADRDVLHVVGKGYSKGTFDWFFKVRDTYETYLDEKGVFPWIFVRDIDEGGFKLKQYYTFDHYKRKVKDGKGREYSVPLGVQDMISSFYYARTMDFSNARPGQVFTIHTFVDEETYPLQIRFLGYDEVEIDKGTFDCMVFVPVVQKGRIFKKEEDMKVWVTNDENKIPLLAKAKILVGSITMEIIDYQNLANPISKVD